ncbi:MAG: SAM-dependent methyltransferase [Planktotalea sp.]|uniref:SAM-dependent methyltransferase n=1 Tax=Planktotalea sp. TaxID=2029877 RepID=UPI003C78E48A
MQTPPLLTDRHALIRNRLRASDSFLVDIARDECLDRLSLVNRTFTKPLIVGPTPDLLPNAHRIEDSDTLEIPGNGYDLALHFMALHWANDPVGQIIQSARALRPDGLFQAVCLGGQTLHELRTSLAQAESDVTGGLSPRIAPMGEVRDLGALLQRAGLALPVADSVTVRTSYASAQHLMRDLRAFGETNALAARLRRPTRRAVFERCAEIYARTFAEDGKIIATFEFLFLSGWAPSADQPKPLRPGSATARLADALKTTEKPLGD